MDSFEHGKSKASANSSESQEDIKRHIETISQGLERFKQERAKLEELHQKALSSSNKSLEKLTKAELTSLDEKISSWSPRLEELKSKII